MVALLISTARQLALKIASYGVMHLVVAIIVAFAITRDWRLALAVGIVEPFFQTIRFKTIAVFYNNPLVWEAFGYEGEAFEYGGYIERGFNDLGWLPDPPEDASPPVEL